MPGAFGERRVRDETPTRMRQLVEAQEVYLHVAPDDRVAELVVFVDEAADVEFFDPAYRTALTRWTSRPAWTGDGVPPATAVEPALRRVPMRNFLPDGSPGRRAARHAAADVPPGPPSSRRVPATAASQVRQAPP